MQVVFYNNRIMEVKYIVYYCLDAIKAFSDDAVVNEEHVLYLISKYRALLLKKYATSGKALSEVNYQTICLNLNGFQQYRCAKGTVLKSEEQIPSMLNVSSPSILLFNGMESENIIFVNFKRFKTAAYTKWSNKLVYSTIGEDRHLYLKSNDPQSIYLKKLKFRAIFEDFGKAQSLNCNGETAACDVMDSELPLEAALVPELIAYIVKEILGVAYRPKDNVNNAADDMSELIQWIRLNMKKPLQKQLEDTATE